MSPKKATADTNVQNFKAPNQDGDDVTYGVSQSAAVNRPFVAIVNLAPSEAASTYCQYLQRIQLRTRKILVQEVCISFQSRFVIPEKAAITLVALGLKTIFTEAKLKCILLTK